MSCVQALPDGGYRSPGASPNCRSEGLFKGSYNVIWQREDWGSVPVGAFSACEVSTMRSYAGCTFFDWELVRIPELRLSRRSALMLLQGAPLNSLLIAGHRLHGCRDRIAGHVVLRSDPWEYWRSTPALTGLQLARLGKLPDELDPKEALAALVRAKA